MEGREVKGQSNKWVEVASQYSKWVEVASQCSKWVEGGEVESQWRLDMVCYINMKYLLVEFVLKPCNKFELFHLLWYIYHPKPRMQQFISCLNYYKIVNKNDYCDSIFVILSNHDFRWQDRKLWLVNIDS